MKKLIPDTIFSRLFLLLFVTLTVSFFVGGGMFSSFWSFSTVDHNHRSSQPFGIKALILRFFGTAIAAWIAARWLSHAYQSDG